MSNVVADSSTCATALTKNSKHVEEQQCKSTEVMKSLETCVRMPSPCTVQSDSTLLNTKKIQKFGPKVPSIFESWTYSDNNPVLKEDNMNHTKLEDHSNSILCKNSNSPEISEVKSCNINVLKEIDKNSSSGSGNRNITISNICNNTGNSHHTEESVTINENPNNKDTEWHKTRTDNDKAKLCLGKENVLLKSSHSSSVVSSKPNKSISVDDCVMNKISEVSELSLAVSVKEQTFKTIQGKQLSDSKPSMAVVFPRVISVKSELHNTLEDRAIISTGIVKEALPVLLCCSPGKPHKQNDSVANDKRLEIIHKFSPLKTVGHTVNSCNEKPINICIPTSIKCENYELTCSNSTTIVENLETKKAAVETDINNAQKVKERTLDNLKKAETKGTSEGSCDLLNDSTSCSTNSDVCVESTENKQIEPKTCLNDLSKTFRNSNASASQKCSQNHDKQKSVKSTTFSAKANYKILFKCCHTSHAPSNCLLGSEQCRKLNDNNNPSIVSSNTLPKGGLKRSPLTFPIKYGSPKRPCTQSNGSGNNSVLDSHFPYEITEKYATGRLNALTADRKVEDFSSKNHPRISSSKYHDCNISDKTMHKSLHEKSVCSRDNVDFLLFANQHKPNNNSHSQHWDVHAMYKDAAMRYALASSAHQLHECFSDIRYRNYFVIAVYVFTVLMNW